MRCIECDSSNTEVICEFIRNGDTLRKRYCVDCGTEFSSKEVVTTFAYDPERLDIQRAGETKFSSDSLAYYNDSDLDDLVSDDEIQDLLQQMGYDT